MEKYKLSGDRDHDQFLDKNDLGEHFEILMSCYHQGQCDDDCENALEYFEIDNIPKTKEYIESREVSK